LVLWPVTPASDDGKARSIGGIKTTESQRKTCPIINLFNIKPRGLPCV